MGERSNAFRKAGKFMTNDEIIQYYDYLIRLAMSKCNSQNDAEDLAGEPTFYQIADEVVEWLTGSDLAGFNSAKFDLPMLAEEIERVRRYTDKQPAIDLHAMKMVDVQNIFHAMEPRTLKAKEKAIRRLRHSSRSELLKSYLG